MWGRVVGGSATGSEESVGDPAVERWVKKQEARQWLQVRYENKDSRARLGAVQHTSSHGEVTPRPLSRLYGSTWDGQGQVLFAAPLNDMRPKREKNVQAMQRDDR